MTAFVLGFLCAVLLANAKTWWDVRQTNNLVARRSAIRRRRVIISNISGTRFKLASCTEA